MSKPWPSDKKLSPHNKINAYYYKDGSAPQHRTFTHTLYIASNNFNITEIVEVEEKNWHIGIEYDILELDELIARYPDIENEFRSYLYGAQFDEALDKVLDE